MGLADSHELNTTVMPLILRGVSLLGASSNNCPISMRRDIWKKLGAEWKPPYLTDTMDREISLSDVLSVSEDMIQRKTKGRIVVTHQK